MTKEPEPKSTGQGSNPPFSMEDQLNAFRARLDGPEKPPMRTLPGFLFRDRGTRKFSISTEVSDLLTGNPIWYPRDELTRIAQQAERANYKMAHIDDDLLKQHAETYIRALETRDHILHRIKPVEIVTMVRDIWGKGEIAELERGATLTYSYPLIEQVYEGWSTTEHHLGRPPGESGWFEKRSGSHFTGKYSSRPYFSVSESITIDFGNSEFPHLASVNTDTVDEFFADSYESPRRYGAHVFDITLFRGIPETIWRRPDNLGICVTVPYALLLCQYGSGYYEKKWIKVLKPDAEPPISWYVNFDDARTREYNRYDHRQADEEILAEDYLPNTSSIYLKTGRDRYPASHWFDQSTSQQEIMDFLAEKLEAQRKVGQLPSQVEALELAKIKELRKRGLFIEPKG